MDGGIIILAFSVEHYSELILRYVEAKMSVRVNLYEARTVCLTFCRNCSLKPALRGFFSLRGAVGAAAVAAVASGRIAERDVGCLASAIDVDADDGSFVVLVDTSSDLLQDCLLFVGLVDPLLLDSEFALSTS